MAELNPRDDDHARDEPKHDDPDLNEPVFGDDPPVFGPDLSKDEPTFDAATPDRARSHFGSESFGKGSAQEGLEESGALDQADSDEESLSAVEQILSNRPPRSSRNEQQAASIQDETLQWFGGNDDDEPIFSQDSSHAGHTGPGEFASDAGHASRHRRLGRTGPFWLIGAGIALIIILGLWLVLRDGGDRTIADDEPNTTPDTAEAVGSLDGQQETSLAVGAATEEEPQPTATPSPVPTLVVGQEVVVANTAGEGIRLRDEPGVDGLTLAIFEEGDAFVVLQPDQGFDQYPVRADNYLWYRIQIAGDPEEDLAGWAASDFLMPIDE